MTEPSQSTSEIDDVIDEAIDQIEVPPAMVPRAKENLLALAFERGVDAVRQKTEAAKLRKERAAAWLLKQRNERLTDQAVVEDENKDVEIQLWKAIENIAKRKQVHSNWAKHFLVAIHEATRADATVQINNPDKAELVSSCVYSATGSDDLNDEPAVIQGSVFSEAGNLLSACAMVTRSRTTMEQSLICYRRSVDAFSKVEDPYVSLLVNAVQLNRGSAFERWGWLIAEKFHFFREDIRSVQNCLAGVGDETLSRFEDFDVNIGGILGSLKVLEEFDDSFQPRIEGKNSRKPPLGIKINNNMLGGFFRNSEIDKFF
ncbi:hypothetical protein V1T76_11325 [Roseibium sp. FZY0029]|uniref:hypothetical protein n=1 Tax=Roseibium sp. FZY0029 TaxID=3116647 RepID=UPI002EC1BA63|nr:hypothetical protein [Roseibium sp. FZY0029]